MGGIEFGSGYENSAHTSVASCQDCHMAEINGRSGGHTFFAAGNFKGCNTTGCHTDVDDDFRSILDKPERRNIDDY